MTHQDKCPAIDDLTGQHDAHVATRRPQAEKVHVVVAVERLDSTGSTAGLARVQHAHALFAGEPFEFSLDPRFDGRLHCPVVPA